MAKYKGYHGRGYSTVFEDGPWERHNNWRKWFGFDLRRKTWDDLQGTRWFWLYGRSKTVARKMLHSAYAPKEPALGEIDQAAQKIWDGVQWLPYDPVRFQYRDNNGNLRCINELGLRRKK